MVFKSISYRGLVLLFSCAVMISSCDKDDDDNGNGNGSNNGNGQNGQAAANRGVGESAQELLKAADFNELKVEIQYPQGYKPKDATLDNLKEFLNQYLNKPEGIQIVKSQIEAPGQSEYSIDDIREIEDANRSVYNQNQTLGVYVFFADGNHEDDTDDGQVLGTAYQNTSTVLFEETIQELSGGLQEPSQKKLETAVLNHEFGHIMGLVALGSPMQQNHQDEDNGNHCDVDDCLMYWATETSDVVDNLLGSGIPTLDAQCQDDLKANGGK